MAIYTRLIVAVILAFAVVARGEDKPTTQPADYASEFQRSLKYGGPRTQENLDRIINALAVPSTHMAALRELIDFRGLLVSSASSSVIYPDGSEMIRGQAGKVIEAAADDATILTALSSSDPLLTYWAIDHFAGLANPRASVPKLKELAQGTDESLRAHAVDTLRGWGESAFVKQLARTEKSPYVLNEELLGCSATGKNEFNPRLCELLKDADPKVRAETVNYIFGQWSNAAACQLFVDASLMDALLACAKSGGGEAGSALNTFTMYSNQSDLIGEDEFNSNAVSKWWAAHRRDWELARFPRWVPSNGSLWTTIIATGDVGGTPGWSATITLRNHDSHDVWVNLAEIADLHWALYDSRGQSEPLEHKQEKVDPEWLDLQSSQSITRPAPIALPAGEALKPGRYTLKAYVELGADRRGLPPKVALLEVQLPLPTITVEVPGTRN